MKDLLMSIQKKVGAGEMADVLTKKQRSYCMSRIRGSNTKPEITLRKGLTNAGLKGYRLNYRLPGKPDITLNIFLKSSF